MEKRIRPFPWKCSNCREKAMFPVSVNYVAELGHDGQNYTVVVPGLEVIQCEKCQTRMLLDGAWLKIEEALRKQIGLLAPSEIESNRQKLGLSQHELADVLQVNDYDVAAWESGMQIQSRAMNRQLLAYFNVPEVRDYFRELNEMNQSISARAPSGVREVVA